MRSDIPFINPEFPSSASMAAGYEKIVANNWYTNFGEYEQAFRAGIERYVGKGAHAVTVNNATNGLIIAMKALFPDPTPGHSEVLMPAFTFAAGAQNLIVLGYTPVFVDIDDASLQPDPAQARAYIEANRDRVAGILFCNVFGTGASNVGEWEELAREYGLSLVIDSAAGFGSRYPDGGLIGTAGDCEVFSFHATKPFAIGEGGAVTTRNADLAARLRDMSNFGFGRDRSAVLPGINAKLQEFNAAIGVHQLARFDEHLTERRAVLELYKTAFADEDVYFQDNDGQSSVAFCSVVIRDADYADAFYAALHDAGVEARRYYNPQLYKHPYIAENSRAAGTLDRTDYVCARIVSLPVHRQIGTREVYKIKDLFDEVRHG